MTAIWFLLRPFWPYLLGAALLVGAWLWFESVLADHFEAGQLSVQQRWDADRERQRILADETARFYASTVNRAKETYDSRIKTATLRASGLAAELARVRASASGTARPPADPASPCYTLDERNRRLELLLREGSELAAEGSGRVGTLDAKVTGLQVYAEGLQPARALTVPPAGLPPVGQYVSTPSVTP